MDRVFTGSFKTKFKSAFRNLKSAILLCALLLAFCFPASAQQPGKVFRIGYLDNSTASGSAVVVEAFRQEMRKLGWFEGKNITIEYRFAAQKMIAYLSLRWIWFV